MTTKTRGAVRVYVVPNGGATATRGKVHEYASFAEFVAAWQDPTPIESARHKTALPYFVGGVLKGKRTDANVQARTLLTLDIEAGKKQTEQPPGPAQVTKALRAAKLAGWVYTTVSHTQEAPRYRVVLPLAEPITDGAVLAATSRATAKALGLLPWAKPESWVLSQAMFLPAEVAGEAPWQKRTDGKATVPSETGPGDLGDPKASQPADMPEPDADPVIAALRDAGLYLGAASKHPGKHFIRCPWADEHGTVNDTQTVYYEAHFDGSPKPACKCLDTEPGEDHLSYAKLVRWLREHGHLPKDNSDTAEVLPAYDTFWQGTAIGPMLDNPAEPLEWAVEGLCPVGKVTVLGGPGGVSKSALALRLLLGAATGTGFGAFKVPGAVPCLYLSYEDDAQTFHSRLRAMYAALEDSPEGLLYDLDKVRANLRIHAVAGNPLGWLLMTKEGRNGTPTATARLGWLAGLLREQGVRFLVIDPVAYTHHLEESSPPEMAAYMQALGQLAAEAGCAVLLLHHMHKAAHWASLEDINAGSLRGASSIADNARSVAVLVSMPAKEAPAWGLPATEDTVSRYAVFKHVKHNYSASLGVQVFERKGALLVPRGDVERLYAAEAQMAREQAKAQAEEGKLNAALVPVLEHLGDGENSTNGVRIACHIRKDRVKGLLEHGQAQGWLTSHDGPRGADLWAATPEGKEWLHEQTSKRKGRK